MNHVKSKDGTAISYTRSGDGPAVVLVGGGLDDGSENATLIPTLADSFMVANYARRGRGDSGDTSPYSLAREIEDLAALVEELGGHAHAFGASSGGALLLEAAADGLSLDRIAVWEVPYAVGVEAVDGWQAYSAALRQALAGGDQDRALELLCGWPGPLRSWWSRSRSRSTGLSCARSHPPSLTTQRASATVRHLQVG
jgi:alpha-beta hydrolase superfamily lysophospholipase